MLGSFDNMKTKQKEEVKSMTIGERKTKLVQQFQEIEQKINQFSQQINQLSIAREQVRGKLILIDELEKEPADNRASKKRVEKIEKKLDDTKKGQNL